MSLQQKHQNYKKNQATKQQMSSIYIQIGQCGCQIGHKLNKKLSNSYYSTRIHTNKCHSIMIDTEPKVLKPFIDNPPKWLDVNNVKYFQYGRGNNWSYGYMHQLPARKVDLEYVAGFKQYSHLTKKSKQQREIQSQQKQQQQNPRQKSPQPKPTHSPQKHSNSPTKPQTRVPWNSNSYTEQQSPQTHESLTQFEQKVLVNKYLKENKQISQYTLERIRKQLDSVDCPLVINVLCSLGGGTGSGLGTKMIEKIYQQFNMDVYAHVVLPNKSGQTPLQLYNCTLSLSSIQQHSTAIFTYQNDKMISTFLPTTQQKQKQKYTGTDLDFINQNISEMQARLFKINDHDTYDRFYNDLVNQCVVGTYLKYLALFGVRGEIEGKDGGGEGEAAFQRLCGQLRVYNQEMYQIDGVDVRREKCLANSMLIMAPSGHQLQQTHRKKLRNILNPWHLNPDLNIQYLPMPKKTPQTQSTQLQMSKISTSTSIGQSSSSPSQSQILLLTNHSNIVRYLEYLSVAGRKKYEAKAYLWHYKYADLETAFNNIDTVIDQYVYAVHD